MLQVISDIHIEQFDEPYYIIDHCVFPDKEQDLVVAGDLGDSQHVIPALIMLSPLFRHVIFVPGNHEYYWSSVSATDKALSELHNEYPNIIVLQKRELTIDSRFGGCTLWSNIQRDPMSMVLAYRYLNDFKLIKDMTTAAYFDLHVEHYTWLKTVVPDIVVTHHAPSLASISQQYVNDDLNAAFATDLSDFVFDSSIRLWVHGHIHNKSDYIIGSTRVVCNPYGYRSAGQHRNFQPLFIED